MSRSVLASCIVMLACKFVMAEDRAASEIPQPKQREEQLHELLVVLFDHSPTSDDGTVIPTNGPPSLDKWVVSVAGIRPNGDLKIEGRSEVEVGGEVWERTLTGEVHRQSLRPDRTVRSEDIAERRITIRKKNIVRNDADSPEVAPRPTPATCNKEPNGASADEKLTGTRQNKIALLQKKQAELERLQHEVRQLQSETGTCQQILVRVQMLEVSLSKMRKLGMDVEILGEGRFNAQDPAAMMKAFEKMGQPYSPPGAKAKSNGLAGFIDWMQQNNLAKVLAEPTIVMVEGRPAQFNVGGEIPIPMKRDPKGVVDFQMVGTQLDIISFALGENRVRLELRMKNSEADYGHPVVIDGFEVPAITTRQCDTAVQTSFGQTSVLSGLLQETTEAIKTEAGIREEKNQVALMLVVTPELVEPNEPFAPPSTALRSGGSKILK